MVSFGWSYPPGCEGTPYDESDPREDYECCEDCNQYEDCEGLCPQTAIESQSSIRVYLCGPINGCTDAECTDWREAVKAEFPNAIDPMRRDYRGREDDCVVEIVELDKIDIMDCDVVLANCPKPSVGTSMEVLYAYTLGKQVACVVPDVKTASPWLRYHSRLTTASLSAAIAAIRQGI